MVEIGKLSKHDLLLMLRDQEIEIRQLKNENEQLKAQLEQTHASVSAQQELGSLAEESVKVSGVMLAAQKAADEYLTGIKTRYASIAADTERMLQETKARCDKMELESRCKADLAWDELKKKLDDYCLAHSELESMLGQTKNVVEQFK